MKKIKMNTAKLQLNKERISSLTNDEMNVVNGGINVDQCTVQNPKPAPAPQPISVDKYGWWSCLQYSNCPSGSDRQYCS